VPVLDRGHALGRHLAQDGPVDLFDAELREIGSDNREHHDQRQQPEEKHRSLVPDEPAARIVPKRTALDRLDREISPRGRDIGACFNSHCRS
jgi:hypothetical protein